MKIRIGLLGVLVLVVALLPTNAYAETYMHRDQRGDLQTMDEDGEDNEIWTSFPDRVEGDIVWTRVTHLPRTIRIRIKFADLARVDGGGFVGVQIKTGATGRSSYAFGIDAAYGNWRGTSDFGFQDVGCECRAERESAYLGRCYAKRHTMDYADDSVLMTLPRRCVMNPRYIRVSIGTFRAAQRGPGFEDDAYAGSPFPTGIHEDRYSPRIYRD